MVDEYFGSQYIMDTSFEGGVGDMTPKFKEMESLDALKFSLALSPRRKFHGAFRNQQLDTCFLSYFGFTTEDISGPLYHGDSTDAIAFSRALQRLYVA
jgi:hypothetical protein